MTQRIFDIENEKDYADLWDILPDFINKIKRNEPADYNLVCYINNPNVDILRFIKINWHDKTEITRPIQEATEQDLGKLCKFWSGKYYAIGILNKIDNDNLSLNIYCMEDGRTGIWFTHCRKLTKQEIEELC